MNYVAYGQENDQVIILLHGGGLSWWNYRETAERLSQKFQVILPILGGHGNSDRHFTSIEENAAEIIQWIDQQCGGSVLLIGGLSLGGQILLEILAQRNAICQYALIESALVIPSHFTYSMIRPAFGSCYGLIHQRWFSKLQFQALRIKQELFEDYFRDTRRISKRDMIAFLQANSLYKLNDSVKFNTAQVSIFVGEKESRVMRRSAEIIQNAIPKSQLQILPNLRHGEFSINHADDYAACILHTVQDHFATN